MQERYKMYSIYEIDIKILIDSLVLSEVRSLIHFASYTCMGIFLFRCDVKIIKFIYAILILKNRRLSNNFTCCCNYKIRWNGWKVIHESLINALVIYFTHIYFIAQRLGKELPLQALTDSSLVIQPITY